MIAVGTHYLPFMFLYGMREFGILAAVLMPRPPVQRADQES